MNYALYEKSITKLVMQSVIDLSVKVSPKKIQPNGILFTIYNKKENLVKIGYVDKLSEIKLQNLCEENQLVDKRYGTKREFELLKITLEEVGHKSITSSGFDAYDIGISKLLNVLGWPTGKSRKIYKRNI